MIAAPAPVRGVSGDADDVEWRVVRRRLLIAGVLPALLAVVFAVKVVLMLGGNADGRAAYAEGDYPAAVAEFAGTDMLNVLDPWVARFGEGSARYRADDLDGAVDRFEAALRDVPREHECTVRINLSLVHERIGDDAAAAGDADAARQSYGTGRDVLADGGCTGDAGQGQEQSQTAEQVDDRLEDKQQRSGAAPPDPGGDPGGEQPSEAPTGQDDQLEELLERNQDGEQDRQDYQELEEQLEAPDEPADIYEW